MFIIIFILLILTTSVIQSDINHNVTLIHSHQSLTNPVDQNYFTKTVVDLLLNLLEKANLSRTISIIDNDQELTELVEHDDDTKTNPI